MYLYGLTKYMTQEARWHSDYLAFMQGLLLVATRFTCGKNVYEGKSSVGVASHSPCDHFLHLGFSSKVNTVEMLMQLVNNVDAH